MYRDQVQQFRQIVIVIKTEKKLLEYQIAYQYWLFDGSNINQTVYWLFRYLIRQFQKKKEELKNQKRLKKIKNQLKKSKIK